MNLIVRDVEIEATSLEGLDKTDKSAERITDVYRLLHGGFDFAERYRDVIARSRQISAKHRRFFPRGKDANVERSSISVATSTKAFVSADDI